MRHDFLDRYARLDSLVHRWPAGLKFALAMALLVAIVVFPLRIHWFFALASALLIALAVASRVPPLFILRRLLMLEPVVLAVAALAIFQPGGWRAFLGLILKSTLCLLTMILLANTTPFSRILNILRTIRVPALLITILALMYRYLFVLIDEAQRMQRARASRTFTTSRAHVWRSLATVAGQLFVRSSERAERIYAAMCARGWK